MLPIEVMRQIRRLQLRAKRTVRTMFGGEYLSTFKGVGLSFEEVREYQPGDDVRSIDWNVTARMGHPFIKRYAEERELTIILVADLSASQQFGTGLVTKRTATAELVSVLAFAAVSHNDQVGLLGFTDRVEKYVPPGKGSRHAMRVLRDVLFFEPSHAGTNMGEAFHYLNRIHRRRAIVFVFSDFLFEYTSEFVESFRRTAKKHELIAVRVSDPREEEWPDIGLLRMEDAETGRQTVIDTNSRAFREQFAARARERREEFLQFARSAQVDLIEVGTDGRHFDALLRFFRLRESRRRGS